MSATAEGESRTRCRPGATSMRVAWAVSPRRTSSGVLARSMSAKRRPERPAHAERLRDPDFPHSSKRAVGWSWRSRSPLLVPRNELVTLCSA